MFGAISAIFVYTSAVTILSDPKGLYLSLLFIAMVLTVGISSRVLRSFELRVSRVELDDSARAVLAAIPYRPLRFVSHHPGRTTLEEYSKQETRVRQMVHLPEDEPFLFLEIEIDDASEFTDVVEVTGRTDSGVVMALRHRDLAVEGVQFHPESVLTEGGHRMLANWLAACGDPGAVARSAGLAPVVSRS